MGDEKTLEQQIFAKCIHFNGVMNDCCKAGIAYDSFPASTEKGKIKLPCWQDEVSANTCDKAEFRTMKQAQAEATDIRQRFAEHLEKITSNQCPTHNIAITKKQVGSCVYAEPCGCRLYQGKVA